MLLVKPSHSTGQIDMHELFRRIAIHAGLTALFLGVVGLLLAEMASTALISPTGGREASAKMAGESADVGRSAADMRTRIPLALAVWGFVVVALYEFVRHLLRGRRALTPVTPPAPDETEKLLEELLRQAEAKSGVGPPPDEAAQPVESAGAAPTR
jgi:hypothetical protein